jgi:predicted permease
VELVSASYFGVLGSPPVLGRAFLPEEDRVPGEPAVAFLSHALWVGQFGADSTVIGRTLRLNTIPLTVVGVASPGFRGLSERADLWVPIMMAPTLTFPRRLSGTFSFWHAVVARVANEAALAASLSSKARAVAEEIPLAEAFGDVELGFHAEPLAHARVHPAVRRALFVLMGAAAFLLLIVCVNVANLLLTQAARRRREMSVRVALGAGPGSIARAMLTESVVLGLLGGVGGLLVATWLLDLVQAIAPPAPAGTPDPSAVTIGLPVLLFNFAVAGATGVGVGLLPVVRTARLGAHAIIKEADLRVSGGRVRGALVTVEVALALVLLVGAGLMIRTFSHLQAIDPGFEPGGLLTATVDLPRQVYDDADVAPFLDAVRARLAASPGVEHASVAYCLPPTGGCDHVGLRIEGREAAGDAPPLPVAMNVVDPDYFRALRIPLLAGRGFVDGDRIDQPRVAIVSRATAERYWPDEQAVGARIQLTIGWDDFAEVIGVVDDVRQYGLYEAPSPMVYLPYTQFAYRSNSFVIRTVGPPLALAGALRDAVRATDPLVPVWDIQTMDERMGATLADTRFTTLLLSLVAGLATLLAALGVFGVMAFSVTARTREFGVRMALGARRADVVRLVLGQGMRAAVIGLVVGAAGALALTRVLEGQLHGVSPHDPSTFVAGAALMTLAALAAAYLPTRRATRVDPMEALRYE